MNYIVGAGITATVASYLFPEHKVIAPDYSEVPKTFFIWKDKSTLRFVKEFGLEFTEREVVVGKIGNNIKKYNLVTNKALNNVPSENKTKFQGFFLNEKLVLPEVIKDKIKEVKLYNLIGENRNYGRWENIIWTAPIDKTIFHKKKFNVHYKPITYLSFTSNKELFPEDYIYLFEDDFLNEGIYRVSKNNNIYSFEMCGFLKEKKENILKIINKYFDLSQSSFFNFSIHPKASIISKEKIEDFGNINFVGRYAECNYEIKLNNVLKKLYELRDKNDERNMGKRKE